MQTFGWLFRVLVVAGAMIGGQTSAKTPDGLLQNCAQVTRRTMGIGSSYEGTIKNETYKFTAKIPGGMTGWGGVSPDAPFHGFTIFLESRYQSCIVFEVHLRVDDADAAQRSQKKNIIDLGNAKGWQTFRSAKNAKKTINLRTDFVFENGAEIDDGTILLISSDSEFKKDKPIYEEFVRSLKFGSAFVEPPK